MKAQKMILLLFWNVCLIAGTLGAQENFKILEEKRKDKWYGPDYFKIQYAGNIGFVSLGLGYSAWGNSVQSDFIYGLVPYDEGEAIIHTFTWKNTFRICEFSVLNKYNLSPTLGFSLSIEPGENSYMDVPDKYPKGYYGPNSFYACLNAGLKTNLALNKERYFSSIDVFFEINTLADYVYYNIISQEDWEDHIISLALGLNVFF